MNQLITSSQPLTMSSREIADLTGKGHSNVKRDIASLIVQLNNPDKMLKDCPVFNPSDLSGHGITIGTFEHCGNLYDEFHLDHDYTTLLVSGYNPAIRLKIIKRWKELEASQAPQLPKTFSEALQLAADQAKQLELQAPKVAFVDNLVDRQNLLTATQIGQKHKLSAIKLNRHLSELGVYSKAVKRAKVFQQWFVDKGFGEVKKTELGYDQPLFTNAGEIWINEKLISEGIV